jgi:hypothetical protein
MMKHVDNNVRQDAPLSMLTTVKPMTAAAYAALLRKKTANRRAAEDRQIAASALADPYL